MLRTLIVMLSALVPLAAAQVQVTLSDGQVIEGELLKEDDQSITVQEHIAGKRGGMSATITYPRSRVNKVEPVVDAKTRYTEMAAKTADIAPAQLGLAEWCRDHDLHDQAVERAQHVLTLDKENSKAKEMLNALGFFELDDKWLSEADYCAKTGKVRYKDQFLTPDEVAAAKAKDAANADAQAKQSDAASAGSRSDRLTGEIAAVDKQIKALEESKATVAKDLSQATADQARYAALVKDLESAQNKADAERRNGNVNQSTANEMNNAQARVDKETPINNKAVLAKKSATARAATLDQQIATLNAKRKDLSDQKAKADQEVATKKALADKAAADAKATSDAKPATPAMPAAPTP